MKNDYEILDVTFCDDVRREDNGKMIIIGAYLNDIIIPFLPVFLPSLCFIVKWRSTKGSVPAGEFRLIDPDGKVLLTIAFHGVKTGPTQRAISVSKIVPMAIEKPGTHVLAFTPKGGRSKRISVFEAAIQEKANKQ